MTAGRTTAAFACLGALILAGCAEKKLDGDKIEAGIKRGLADRTGARIAFVSCPDDVEAKKGDTFRCSVMTAKGERLQVEVTQEDSEGRVRWQLLIR